MPEKSSNKTMGPEGATFWANKVQVLVAQTGDERHAIEKRVQIDIMDYYDRLFGRAIDWCVPPRSRLVGHGPGAVIGPKLTYQHDGKQPEDAQEFFAQLGA